MSLSLKRHARCLGGKEDNDDKGRYPRSIFLTSWHMAVLSSILMLAAGSKRGYVGRLYREYRDIQIDSLKYIYRERDWRDRKEGERDYSDKSTGRETF